MKTNIIKGGKSALSILLAIAMLAVSIFTVNIGISASAAQPTDEWDGAYTQPTQIDKNGNILVTTAEELAWVALKSGDAGKGKSYKVADGVKAFYINANTSNLTLAQVTNKLNGNNTREWVYQNQIFQGSFDGNGVTVYGLYSTASDQYNHNGGLFPYIKGNVTIKNVKIANSYIGSYGVGGAVAGQLVGDANVSKIAFSNIAVTNNYIFTAANTGYIDSATGIFGGGAIPASVSFENCAVYGNTHYSKSGEQCAAFIGQFNSQNYTVKNSIALGVTPIGAQNGYWTRLASCYENVYTDQDMSTACWGDTSFANGTVNQVSATTGYAAKAAMPNLDWNNIWWANVGCPELRIFHSLKLADNGDGTHALKCEDCGRKGLSEAHKYTVDSKLKRSVCACGSVKELTSYEWKGRVATGIAGGSGTETDPYIIANAEQLAYLALSTTLDSAGKYYKVVDNAIFNMNGMQGVDKTSDADTVKNAAKKTGYNWTADDGKFSGNFDGNGVIIYNLYSKGGYCGLFPNMNTNNADKSSTIKNVTVLSSYISGYHYSGGIVGLASASTTSQKLIFENCAVENCYISDNGSTNPACNRTSGTIVGSVAHNGTTISNCLAKNNITAATDISGGFIGTTSNYAAAMSIKDSVSIGTLPYSTLTAGSTKTIGTKANQPGDYINVYTDKAVDASFTGVKTLTTAQMTGANALNSMKLDFDGTWFANTSTLELQVSHRLEGTPSTADKYAGHTARCTDCGIEGVTVINHTYDDSSVCTVCKFECDHKSADHLKKVEDKDGDCVTAPNTKTICDCGHIDYEYHGTAEGHKLVKTDAVAATCASAGNKAYWTCSVCGKIFLTDDVMAPMNTAVSADDVVIAATGAHVELRDSNGELVYGMDGDKHWTYCEVCQTKITETAHNVIYTIDGANGHSGKCADCLYEVTKDEKHIFGNDNVCDKCNWACPHDASTMTKVDAVKVACSNAGNLEYYKCNVCGLLFKDAAATVPTTEDEVTIPKLNHNYVDVDQDGNPIYRYDDKGHWHECTECGKGDYAEHTIETDSKRYEGVYKWCEDANGYGCGYSTFDYAYANEDESVSITATTNAFSKDVITDVFEIGKDDSKYDDVKSALGKLNVKNFVAYEISPSENMADGSKALVTIALPKTISGDIAIYYVDLENGTSKMLNTKLIADEKDKVIAASVTTDRLGYFAIAEIGLVIDDGTTNGGNNNYNNGSASSGSGAGTDYRNTSPSTGDSFVPEFIGATMLLGAAVTLSRKAKKYN